MSQSSNSTTHNNRDRTRRSVAKNGAIGSAAKGRVAWGRCFVPTALLAILLLTAGIRVHRLGVPLQRDEGEYAYAGQLILQGIGPYAQVYNMKMPGVYAAYALILAAFGETTEAVHLGLLVVNAATILLVFALARRLFDPIAAVVAAAAFALLALGQQVQGLYANAEHFVIPCALGGIILLQHDTGKRRWLYVLGAGVLLGLACLMKQHGGAFVVFGGLYVLAPAFGRRQHIRKGLAANCAIFAAGVGLPFGLTCLVLWRLGVFEKFWFWTFHYAWAYVSGVPLTMGIKGLTVRGPEVIRGAILIWVTAGVGVTALWWNSKIRAQRWFMLGFGLLSFLAICPGLFFRFHYFIFLLPAVALLAGAGVSSLKHILAQSRARKMTPVITTVIVLVILGHGGYQQRKCLFAGGPTEVSRLIYRANPFPESQEIGRFIRENSAADDRIAVIGSEPQIYFYADRRSATGFIYTYALMEQHKYARQMQDDMIREIEAARPKFLIYVHVRASWSINPDSDKKILEWFEEYQREHYWPVGIVDLVSPEMIIYRWRENAQGYSPRSDHWLVIYQRSE